MLYWIYDHPSLLIGFLFAFAFALAMWTAIFSFRPKFHAWFHRNDKRSDEMLHFAFSSIFALYGLLLGLLSVAAYQNFSDVGELVTDEASTLATLYRDVRGYPKPIKDKFHIELRDYTEYVITKNWACQQKGISTNEGAHRLTKLIDQMMNFNPTNSAQEVVHAEALKQVNLLAEVRSTRIDQITKGIPGEMWWVVALGAIVSIFMVALMDMKLHVHLILGTAFSVFLGVVIFVVAMMDNPFRGQLSISQEPFQEVYDSLIKPNDDVMKSVATLISEAQQYGNAKLEGNHPVANRDVAGLYFGDTLINNTTQLVDDVALQHGGTATLFVRDGEDFVRVSTNVMKDSVSRAVGTILDPEGPVINAIKSGSAYYGAATILGKPYFTAYEPIYDNTQKVIGIYFVGFSLGINYKAGVDTAYQLEDITQCY